MRVAHDCATLHFCLTYVRSTKSSAPWNIFCSTSMMAEAQASFISQTKTRSVVRRQPTRSRGATATALGAREKHGSYLSAHQNYVVHLTQQSQNTEPVSCRKIALLRNGRQVANPPRQNTETQTTLTTTVEYRPHDVVSPAGYRCSALLLPPPQLSSPRRASIYLVMPCRTNVRNIHTRTRSLPAAGRTETAIA